MRDRAAGLRPGRGNRDIAKLDAGPDLLDRVVNAGKHASVQGGISSCPTDRCTASRPSYDWGSFARERRGLTT